PRPATRPPTSRRSDGLRLAFAASRRASSCCERLDGNSQAAVRIITVETSPTRFAGAVMTQPAPLTNRLIHETSPYLRQHAHNPVDWYPWGEEALRRAKELDQPIFLSIGYSACHWCHVMEHESFEDSDTAKILNEHFISIKVDREERPDLDQ